MPTKISIIIPCYNEAEIIESTIKKVANFFNQSDLTYEIIVVDDGSRDNTAKLAQAAGARVLINSINQGKGYSVKKGVESAQGELILFSDADLSTPIDEINKLIKYLDWFDIIIGSRAMPDSEIKIGQSWPKILIGKIGNWIIRLILNLPLADTQCGFKLFKKGTLPIFKKQTLNRWGFDFELLFIAKKMGYRVKEVGICWYNDKSSTVTFGGYWKTLGEVIKVRFNSWQSKYNEKPK
jgi:dolichyl-phosphate beta-glucosyltransferase